MKRVVMMLVAMVAVASWAAPQAVPLTIDERAYWDATHCVILEHDDFSTATTNTAQTVALFSVPANTLVRFSALVLETAFKDSADTNHNSTAITIGDGTDADLFLASTELNENGTEVMLAFGRANGGTIAVTAQTTTLSYLDATTNAATLAVCTNATAVLTASVLGEKLYTAADTVDVTATPNAEDALSSLDTGKARLYFRMHTVR
jgi:hypothetical protein